MSFKTIQKRSYVKRPLGSSLQQVYADDSDLIYIRELRHNFFPTVLKCEESLFSGNPVQQVKKARFLSPALCNADQANT